MEQGVGVDILDISVPKDLEEFVGACHRTSVGSTNTETKGKDILSTIGTGKTLWQCGEVITFGIRLSNVSRVFTHQLVRARVGVSFSQQCTGDVDMRHADFLVPNCFYRDDERSIREQTIKHFLDAKMLYVDMLARGFSIQEARYALPAGLAGHINMRICLGSLAELYKKRSCSMTQTWEMVVFADKLKSQIAEKAPWALPLFKSCRHSKGQAHCWWHGTKDTPFANTHLWKPDSDHDRVDCLYNIASFVHPKTHKEVSSGPDAPDLFYSADTPIDRASWESAARRVGLLVPAVD